ncbi:MAG: hypothetical protein LYZ69_02900 [Nitrososphaerales archaeon]|nr:hypothetical protein [Nitrososphaerales archaeon]
MEVRCYVVAGGADPERLRESVRGAAPKLLVQTVRTSALSNESLAEMIVAQTLRASLAQNLLAKKLEIDLLLRLAGTTQITEAIRSVGARAGEDFIFVAAGEGEELNAAESLGVLGAERLPRGTLGRGEMMRVEESALLNAQRT